MSVPARRSLLAVMLTMLFMYQADATVVNVATPSIRADLGASGAQLELVIGGYLLASATLLITGARLGYLHGYRRVFLTGVALFGLASLCCGLAPGPVALIVARVVQGIGGALAFPQVLTAIQVHFDGPGRSRALSRYAIALAAGAVAGQIAGGVLVGADLFGLQWRAIFLINVPIAAAVVLAGLRVIPHEATLDRTKRLDLPGALTLSSAVLLVVLPLTVGRQAGWPLWTWLCLAASAPMLAGFAAIEQRRTAGGRSPLINLAVIRRPPIALGLFAQAAVTATYYALLFTMAQYLQQGLGYSAVISGLTLVPWVVAFGVPGRLLGRLSPRSQRHMPWLGCAILGLAYALLAADMLTGTRPVGTLLVLLALGGLGLGTSFSAMLVHLAQAATPRYAADISGVFTTSLQIAGALGVAALGTLYLSRITSPGASTSSHAFGIVCAAGALVAWLAALAAHRATQTQPSAAGTPAPAVQAPARTS
ncbi:MAG TPA: MFS transporter [Streptosporangiaceae bacterium]|nr:MFS transporter [Streptosporangiaceae bacterium]